MKIRTERPSDVTPIHLLTEAAFKHAPHSSQTEARIVDALREAGVLTVSLVAVDDERVVGHVAFSPVTINGVAGDWYGLGPVSVAPQRQGEGIGHALICDGLDRLRSMNAAGCVVLGEPDYYGRFGFQSDPELRYGEAPVEYFQRLIFSGPPPKGWVSYHPGFDVA